MNDGQKKVAAPKAPSGEGNELIKHKKQIQLELKDLNRRIKELKQLLRGGRIDEPLNPALPQLAEKIVQDTSQAANDVKEIAKDQADYAARHQGKSPRPPGPPVAELPTAPAEQKLELPPALLEAAASSRWTRLMTYMKSPFQTGDADRWERLRLLRTAADINDALKDIENAVLTSHEIAIPNAVYSAGALYHVIESDVVNKLMLKLGEEPKGEGEEEEEGPAPEETVTTTTTTEPTSVTPPQEGLAKPEYDRLAAYKLELSQKIEGWPDRRYGYQADIADVNNRLASFAILRPQIGVSEDVRNSVDVAKARLKLLISTLKTNPRATYEELESQNREVENAIATMVAKAKGWVVTHGVNWDELLMVLTQPQPAQPDETQQSVESMSADEALEKLAQSVLDRKLTHNVLTRYLKRKWVSVFGGPTRGLRISAAQAARNAREKLDAFMDVLEQPASFRMMAKAFVPFLGAYSRLLPMLVRLGDEHNKYAKLERAEQRMKGKRITVDPIQKMELNQLSQMIGKKEVGGKIIETGPGLYRMEGRLQNAIAAGPRRKPRAAAEQKEEDEEPEGEAA